MDKECEPRPAARCCPLQHLQITIRVAKCGDGPAADKFVDGDGLAFLVVEEIKLGEFNEHGFAVVYLILDLAAAADHLFGRYSIDPFSKCPHKVDPAPRDNIGLETVGTQVR